MFGTRIPTGVPVLATGRHRSPRSGGCFMEFASYLAGERWSDHPPCTHPLLAALARDVNDLVDDEHRAQLVPLIPDVVGLNGEDPILHVTIAARAGTAALLVACMESQRALATGLLTVDQIARALPHPSVPALRASIADALAMVPGERQWAIRRRQQLAGTAKTEDIDPFLRRGAAKMVHLAGTAKTEDIDPFLRRGAAKMVHLATSGIAGAAIMDPNERLIDLLTSVIAEVRVLTALPAAPHAGPAALPEPATEPHTSVRASA